MSFHFRVGYLEFFFSLYFTHDIALIQEGLKRFAKFSQKLKDQAEVAKANIEVTEELRKAREARELNWREDLQSSQELNHRLEAQVKSLEEKLATKKASISKLKIKLSDSDSRRKIAEERVEVLKTEVKDLNSS